jgi:hypothetical protein
MEAAEGKTRRVGTSLCGPEQKLHKFSRIRTVVLRSCQPWRRCTKYQKHPKSNVLFEVSTFSSDFTRQSSSDKYSMEVQPNWSLFQR